MFQPVPWTPTARKTLAGGSWGHPVIRVKIMTAIFDIGFVTRSFHVTNLKHYLEKIQSAPTRDLRQFRSEVKRHRKKHRQNQAFSDVPNFSTHDAIIATINHELRKRYHLSPLFSIMTRIRKPVVRLFTGFTLKEDEYFGAIYSRPQRLTSVWHMPNTEFIPLVTRFMLRNWANILIALGTLLDGIAALITALQKNH